MPAWFYERSGMRSGPHSTTDLQRLAQAGHVLANTMCWREAFGPNAKPFSETGLCRPIAAPEPPPLIDRHVTGIYAWTYALLPLIGEFIKQAGLIPDDLEAGSSLSNWLLFSFLYLLLAKLDSNAIARAGNPRVSILWFWVMSPVYLWMRALALQQRWKPQFCVMHVSVVGAGLIDVLVEQGSLSRPLWP